MKTKSNKKKSLPHNILILEAGFGKGGSSTALYYFLQEMDRKQFNPIVGFYYRPYNKCIINLKNLGIEVLQFNVPVQKKTIRNLQIVQKVMKYPIILFEMVKQELPSALKIARIIRKEEIKMVMFNNDIGLHTIGFLAVKIARVPCVVTKGGYGYSRKITRIFSPYVNGFFAISNASAKDQLIDYPKLKKIPIIYRGIPLKNFNTSFDAKCIRNELGIPQNHFVITSISRISPGKGHFELIQAAEKVLKKNTNTTFLVVGDDVELEGKFLLHIKENVRNLNLQNNFIFTGWRSDIPELLSATDIFVHCPTQLWMEGLGIVALEAAAMAKPMIVTNNYGLAETVINGKTGYVVKMGDHKAIAQAILKLLENKELRLSLGNNARKMAEERFNNKKNTKKIEEYLLRFIPSN